MSAMLTMTMLRRGSYGTEVRDLQLSLNRSPPPWVPTVYPRLTVDGIFGPLTEERVRVFQRNAGLTVDGIVGPITRLELDQAHAAARHSPDPPATGQPASPTIAVPFDEVWEKPRAPGLDQYNMREISVAELEYIGIGTGAPKIGSRINGTKPGTILPCAVGRVIEERLVFSISEMLVTFLVVDGPAERKGRFYLQRRDWFDLQWEAVMDREIVRRTRGMRSLAEAEAHLLMGIAGSAGIAAFVGVGAIQVLHFYTQNEACVKSWIEAVKEVLSVREALRRIAPTLWTAIFHAALFDLARQGVDLGHALQSPHGILRDPNKLAKLVGKIIGALGRELFKGRLNALQVITLVLKKSAVSIVRNTYRPEIQSVDTARIVEELRMRNVMMTGADADKVMDELRARPLEVQRELERLDRAFLSLGQC
jgi:hypothetical protein